jgi:hypothetical protein
MGTMGRTAGTARRPRSGGGIELALRSSLSKVGTGRTWLSLGERPRSEPGRNHGESHGLRHFQDSTPGVFTLP